MAISKQIPTGIAAPISATSTNAHDVESRHARRWIRILRLIVAIVTLAIQSWAQLLHAATTSATIKRGDIICAPATPGTSTSILGIGFDSHLKSVGESGSNNRLYPLKLKDTKENTYGAKLEFISNETLQSANAGILFFNVGSATLEARRYAVLTVYQILKTTTLILQGDPKSPAPFTPTKIHYGWAVRYIIEGESSSFTSRVGVTLQSLLQSGASSGFADELKRSHLRITLSATGLQNRNAGDVPIALSMREMEAKFQIPKNPQPIMIEYTALEDMDVPSIDWNAPAFAPGKYLLRSIQLEAAQRKSNREAWDPLGGLPDPSVRIVIGRQILAIGVRNNTLRAEFEVGKIVTITPGDVIGMAVEDEDVDQNDPIGMAAISCDDILKRHVGDTLALETNGQLLRASIVLDAVTQ